MNIDQNLWVIRVSLFAALTMAGFIVILVVILILDNTPWSLLIIAAFWALSKALEIKESPSQ